METAQNAGLSEIYAKLKNLAALTSNITRKSPHIEKISARAHVEIIDIMLEADEEKSERLMREHLRETCRHIVEGFYPGMFGDPRRRREQRDNCALLVKTT
jgi:DNA-binding GntR family transcriptional regulator